MVHRNKHIGQVGEDLAIHFLKSKDFRMIERNWRTRSGEVDIICLKNDQIAFVEVKTRMTPYLGWGEEAINQHKKQKYNKLINEFFDQADSFVNYYPRFDLVVVNIQGLKPEFIHYENIELNIN